MTPVTRVLAGAAAASLLLAAGPALAAPKKVKAHPACAVPSGAMVVSPSAPFEADLTPPVGVLNLTTTEIGELWVDLKGVPATARGSVTLTLTYDNPLSDYDLVINGSNSLSTDNPEVHNLKVSHCKRVELGLEVFTGVPVDSLTLAATVRSA